MFGPDSTYHTARAHRRVTVYRRCSFCICGIAAIEATEILSDSGGRSEVFTLLLILDMLYHGDHLYMGGEMMLNMEFKWYHVPGLLVRAGIEATRSIVNTLKIRK